jgi:hypothetical protein
VLHIGLLVFDLPLAPVVVIDNLTQRSPLALNPCSHISGQTRGHRLDRVERVNLQIAASFNEVIRSALQNEMLSLARIGNWQGNWISRRFRKI